MCLVPRVSHFDKLYVPASLGAFFTDFGGFVSQMEPGMEAPNLQIG